MCGDLRTLGRPFNVSFEVTSQCSLRCWFCCAQLSKYGRHDLPTKDAQAILDKLAEEGIFSVFLTGGEPLSREDLPQLIETCMNHGMNVSLSTNGLEATERTARLIAETGLDEVQVSIHAPNEIHDEIVGVSGALDRSLRGLRNLVGAGLRVTVAAVATRMNYSCLPELVEQVAQMGARYFRVLRLMPHSQDMLRQTVPCQDMRVLVERLMDLEAKLQDFTISIHASPGFTDARFHRPEEHGLVHPLCHTCSAGKAAMGILSDGDCVPCLELKAPEFVCGNILRDPFAKMWNSKPMSLLRSVTPHAYHGRCAACEFKWTCYSARCVAYHVGGDLLGDDESCYLLSERMN